MASEIDNSRSGSTTNGESPPCTPHKVTLITGITGQDGSYLTEFLLDKGYGVHGLIWWSSNFNTQRINHIYIDPHKCPQGSNEAPLHWPHRCLLSLSLARHDSPRWGLQPRCPIPCGCLIRDPKLHRQCSIPDSNIYIFF